MSRRYSSWRSFSSPNMRSSSTSENPITAFRGVRSSCDMLARNSDLCAPATSSWRVFSSSSRNRRALWMATADWLASVSISSTVRSENPPTTRRRTTSAPMMSCSRSSGTASIERHPAARTWSMWGSDGSSSRSGAWRGSPAGGGAADERLVQVDPRRPQRLDQRRLVP